MAGNRIKTTIDLSSQSRAFDLSATNTTMIYPIFRAHEFLSIYDPEYWSFSFDEMGKYDIPAAVDYILNNTQANDLYYIGHSMGTSMFWVAMNQVSKKL